MDHSLINAVFKPKPNKLEVKADATTRIAREIHDTEAARRVAKSERLRTARLAHEFAGPKGQIKPGRKRTVR